MQNRQPGNADEKRKGSARKKGIYFCRVKEDIRLNKKRLNKKVRRASCLPTGRCGYKRYGP